MTTRLDLLLQRLPAERREAVLRVKEQLGIYDDDAPELILALAVGEIVDLTEALPTNLAARMAGTLQDGLREAVEAQRAEAAAWAEPFVNNLRSIETYHREELREAYQALFSSIREDNSQRLGAMLRKHERQVAKQLSAATLLNKISIGVTLGISLAALLVASPCLTKKENEFQTQRQATTYTQTESN